MEDSSAVPNPDCPGCVRLQERVEQLESLVAKLQDRLNNHSGNSSIPPSANPPQAPGPKGKPKSGRKRGGQPGHRGQFRERIPIERVTRVVNHVPEACSCCRAPLSKEPQAGDPEPTWHQVIEIPPVVITVIEHRGHARTCEDCGTVTRQPIPPNVAAHVVGTWLTAFLSYMVGRHHLSRRGIKELLGVFGAQLSLGTIMNLEREVADALARPHVEAGTHVRRAGAKNADETGWKLAGATRWLWTLATATVAYFVIHARRGREGLDAVTDGARDGHLTSDRWGAYGSWPLEKRQVCWAHLIRDFTKCVERGGDSQALGSAGLSASKGLFAAWCEFRDGSIDRDELQRRIAPIRARLRLDLEQARGSPIQKLSNFARNLLDLEPALWLFAGHEGVEPTNNHAERVLRRGVLWRKNAFGSASDSGTRFVERMLTVVQTLRLQDRPVLTYLAAAIHAHRHGQPSPQLVR